MDTKVLESPLFEPFIIYHDFSFRNIISMSIVRILNLFTANCDMELKNLNFHEMAITVANYNFLIKR